MISDPMNWSPEFRTVVSALCEALSGRMPTAELLLMLAPRYEHLIPGHETRITYSPRGTYDPKKWNLITRQLCEAVNSVCPNFAIRLC